MLMVSTHPATREDPEAYESFLEGAMDASRGV
jgi:hypothetical protein